MKNTAVLILTIQVFVSIIIWAVGMIYIDAKNKREAAKIHDEISKATKFLDWESKTIQELYPTNRGYKTELDRMIVRKYLKKGMPEWYKKHILPKQHIKNLYVEDFGGSCDSTPKQNEKAFQMAIQVAVDNGGAIVGSDNPLIISN